MSSYTCRKIIKVAQGELYAEAMSVAGHKGDALNMLIGLGAELRIVVAVALDADESSVLKGFLEPENFRFTVTEKEHRFAVLFFFKNGYSQVLPPVGVAEHENIHS